MSRLKSYNVTFSARCMNTNAPTRHTVRVQASTPESARVLARLGVPSGDRITRTLSVQEA